MNSRVTHAGGIVFRGTTPNIEILLVTAKRNRRAWIFPKGHVEKCETLEETAVREVEEEAGVVGDIVAAIGPPVEFDGPTEHVSVQYFLIRMVKETSETDGRKKRWVPFEDAERLLTYDNTRALMPYVRAHREKHSLHGA
jgi:ADP-ribose pyrophosphatase YjhB (NUDIX family)